MEQQMDLFGNEDLRPKPKRTGSNRNSIVFHDYESFLAKFADNPKTTDDCFTPKDVYEAVVEYVGTIVDLSDKVILRPFFPGGDYENAVYPENGIVIDNPPFSMFLPIVKFYTARDIPFFLFGPGMTIVWASKYCTVLCINNNIVFENGASVACNFASNLFGDIVAMTAPLLSELIAKCKSQNTKQKQSQYIYPANMLCVSDLQAICKGGIDFAVKRSETHMIDKMDLHPKKCNIFGTRFLISDHVVSMKEEALEASRQAQAQAQAGTFVEIELSQREKRIVERLNQSHS
jgi:hypothetical protein